MVSEFEGNSTGAESIKEAFAGKCPWRCSSGESNAAVEK